jgi:hypothetical protein
MEQNPVRAGMTSCAWEWRWSSAAARIGLVPSDVPLDWSLWKERHDPETWRKVLELGLREAAFAERLRQATERGRPLEPVAFLEKFGATPQQIRSTAATRSKTQAGGYIGGSS